MILSDCNIEFSLVNEGLYIEPYNKENLQPASYDVTLSDEFIKNIGSFSQRSYRSSITSLQPGEFILGSTIEKVKIPHDLVARVEGKSSIARLGLMVHITAGFVDPGYQGNITLELFNVNSKTIELKAGMKIAQLSFHRLCSPCIRPYGSEGLGSKYQNSVGTVESIPVVSDMDGCICSWEQVSAVTGIKGPHHLEICPYWKEHES